MSVPSVENLEELIRSYIGKDKKIIDTKTTRLTAPGENFGSVMLRLDLTLKDGKRNSEEKLGVVAKLIPESEKFQQIFRIQTTYKNEIAFYDTIVPTIQEFQRQQGSKQVWDLFPKLYGARINMTKGSKKVDKDAAFILENLIMEGYTNVDRYIGSDMETTKLILRNLARFHAVPLALKLKNPETFEKKLKPHMLSFQPGDDTDDGELNKYIMDIVKDSKVQHFSPIIKKSLEFSQVAAFREPFATIAHKDLWINNVMIKFEEGKPVETKLLDFQNYSYDSPATDLLFFLSTSVQTELLEEHLDQFIRYYHQQFIETLEDLKCPTKDFSFEAFLEELKASGGPEISHIAFFLLVIVFGKKQNKLDGEHPVPDLPSKEDVLPEGMEKLSSVLKEFDKRQWLNF